MTGVQTCALPILDSLMVDRKVIQEEYVVYFTGKILDNGKIEISKTKIRNNTRP